MSQSDVMLPILFFKFTNFLNYLLSPGTTHSYEFADLQIKKASCKKRVRFVEEKSRCLESKMFFNVFIISEMITIIIGLVKQVRFRDIMKNIYDTKVGMSDRSSSAFFSLTQAEYAAGTFDLRMQKKNILLLLILRKF